MRLTRSFRRAAITTAATGLLFGALVGASPAQAAAPTAASPEAAQALADQLGDRAAGTYLDQSTGKMVVNVTTQADAQAVRAAGAVARFVSRSGAVLQAAVGTLDRSARIAGTAWSVDPITNQVQVTMDSTVTGANLARLNAVVKGLGDAVRVDRVDGTFSTLISGGQAINTGGARCSLGFNVRVNGVDHFVTAGHCTNIGSTWTAGGQTLGTRVASRFPGDDMGIVRYTSGVARPGNVWLWSGSSTQDITSIGNPTVGLTVRRSGSTTGVRSGRITAFPATVNYPQGTVSGLIRTTVCAEPGDSGGSLFAGTQAIGLTSGGSGNCTFGGTTFFEDMNEVRNIFGAQVY